MDEWLVRWANSVCGRWRLLDGLMNSLEGARPFFLVMMLLGLAVIVLAPSRAARRRWLIDGLAVALALIAGGIAGRVLAAVAPPRPRPLRVVGGLRGPGWAPLAEWRHGELAGRPETSMPSTHAILGSGIGFCLIWFRPRLGATVTALGMLLMVPPVLYFGVHWPSDVAAGLAIAALAGRWAAGCRRRLAGPARRLDAAIRRWPVPCWTAAGVLAALVVWRGGPHVGLLRSVTGALRQVFGH